MYLPCGKESYAFGSGSSGSSASAHGLRRVGAKAGRFFGRDGSCTKRLARIIAILAISVEIARLMA